MFPQWSCDNALFDKRHINPFYCAFITYYFFQNKQDYLKIKKVFDVTSCIQ